MSKITKNSDRIVSALSLGRWATGRPLRTAGALRGRRGRVGPPRAPAVRAPVRLRVRLGRLALQHFFGPPSPSTLLTARLGRRGALPLHPHARAGANFRGLVLGCIKAKFCK